MINSNNNIAVIIEIGIEIHQGASLRMGSLHHIQVIGSDIEGRDYNNNNNNYIKILYVIEFLY